MSYVFMPEIVGHLSHANLSKWIDDNQLLKHTTAFHREFDVEKALRIEHEWRVSGENTEPTLCFTIDEMIQAMDSKLPKQLVLETLEKYYQTAKDATKYFEVISKPYREGYCLRLFVLVYKSRDYKGWNEVTLQIVEIYKKKWKGSFVDRKRVCTLGFHVEKADSKLVSKYLKPFIKVLGLVQESKRRNNHERMQTM